MSGKGSTQTVTQNSKPWNADEMKNANNAAANLYSQNIGYQPFPDPTYVPFSNQSLAGLQKTEDLATAGSPTIGAANSYLSGSLTDGGMSSGLLGSMAPLGQISSGQNAIGTQNYQNLYGQAQQPTNASQNLATTAAGGYLGGSPYLMDALQRGAQDIQMRSGTAAAGAGRYGSGLAAQGAANALGDYYRQALQSNYDAERSRQLQASGQIDSANQGLLGMGLSAAQGLSGVQGANITNQLNASNTEAGLYNQGLQRALQSASLAPTLDQARYNDANALMTVGGQYENKTNQALQDAINRWNSYQQLPYQQLNAYNSILQGTGALGQSSTTTQPGASTLATTIGGGAAGAGLLGMLGGTAALGPLGWALPVGGALLGAFR